MLIVGHGFLTYSSRFSLHDCVSGKYNGISELGHTTGDKMKVIAGECGNTAQNGTLIGPSVLTIVGRIIIIGLTLGSFFHHHKSMCIQSTCTAAIAQELRIMEVTFI